MVTIPFPPCRLWPLVSASPDVQRRYEAMRERGESHRLAEMLATGETPGLLTDVTFLAGRGGCYDQFQGQHEVGDYYRQTAESAGVSTTGKVYLSSLAAFPGDPEAWVSGRGDVARVLDARGWGAEGSVTRPVREVAPASSTYRVADDLVRARADDLQSGDPSLSREDALVRARSALSPHWRDTDRSLETADKL